MAFFGLFGKKKEEMEPMPDFTKDEMGLGLEERQMPEEQPPIGAPPGFGMSGFSQEQPMQQRMPQQQMAQPHEREYEVLSAKLDALKAILDSINQRLENLERIARGDHDKYY